MTTRRAAAWLAAGTLALVPLAVPLAPALPASAAAPSTTTTTTSAVPDQVKVDFGDTVDVAVDVASADDDALTAGTSTLYARPAGARRWRAVETSTSASSDFIDVRPRKTTSYKVVYRGYSPTSSADESFAPSTSGVFVVQVARTITYPSGGFDLTGRVRPGYANRRIVVKVSSEEHGGFEKYARISTDDRGRYRISLPRRSGEWFWAFIVKGDEQFLGTRFKWRTWVS
jgi:hypothetical protein